MTRRLLLAVTWLVMIWCPAFAAEPPGKRAADALLVEPPMSAAERQAFVERLQGPGPGMSERAARLLVDPASVGPQRAEFLAILRASSRTSPRRPLYEHWIGVIGANGILDAIEALSPKCHDEAHDLGKVIATRAGDIAAALQVCANRCYSGCMHGVVMEAYSGTGSAAAGTAAGRSLKPAVDRLCHHDPEMTAAYSPGDCAHGFGHALMYLAQYDVGRAIERCKEFEAPAMRYYCATGAYMEYVNERERDDAGKRRLLYPCDVADYPAACARYKLGRVATRHYRARKSTEALVGECQRLDGKFRRGCFHGLGNAHAGMIAARRVTLEKVCFAGSEVEQRVCIEGAVERLAKYYPESAPRACADLTGPNRETCLAAVRNGMYSMTKDLTPYLE